MSDRTIHVPGTNIRYRPSSMGGWEWSEDGEIWYFSQRSEAEIREMHRLAPAPDTDDAEREVFGETMDEPIPEDLWAMIKSL